MGKRILPERLKNIREAQGLTQLDLAEETGLSQNAICKYERGNYMRNSPNFKIIADFFGVSLEWLVGDEFVEGKAYTQYGIFNTARDASNTLPVIAYRLREEKGVTISDVSREIGVSISTIYGIENGTNIPRLDTAARLADYYGVTLDALWGNSAE